MPIFEYKAVDSAQKRRKGIIDADSPREARLNAPEPLVLYENDSVQLAVERMREFLVDSGSRDASAMVCGSVGRAASTSRFGGVIRARIPCSITGGGRRRCGERSKPLADLST